LLTIFTTPVVYLYFDRAQQSLARRGWGVRSSPNIGPEAQP
jgi:multidrug efflux pump